MIRFIAFFLLLILLALPVAAQMPPIGIIDFYGLRHVSEQQARQALQVTEGDPVPDAVDAAQHRLEALPGVAKAHISRVCCDNGRAILYVGIAEQGVSSMQFRPAPRGAIRLPSEIVQAGEAFERALTDAVERGDAGEDDSKGHALMHDPAARAIQERLVSYAARDLKRLREVLHHSADARQRALAAQVLGYAAEKRDIIGDLIQAMRDPDEEVRNNSMRALGVIARFAQQSPKLHIRVPPEPFVEMLNSLVWTDRNKASSVLMELTEKRDPVLLRSLRERALRSLIEMARWKSPGHRVASFFILGRVARLPEDEIRAAWNRGDGERVIGAALKAAN